MIEAGPLSESGYPFSGHLLSGSRGFRARPPMWRPPRGDAALSRKRIGAGRTALRGRCRTYRSRPWPRPEFLVRQGSVNNSYESCNFCCGVPGSLVGEQERTLFSDRGFLPWCLSRSSASHCSPPHCSGLAARTMPPPLRQVLVGGATGREGFAVPIHTITSDSSIAAVTADLAARCGSVPACRCRSPSTRAFEDAEDVFVQARPPSPRRGATCRPARERCAAQGKDPRVRPPTT